MCRMLGFIGESPVPLRKFFVEAPNGLLGMSLRGKKAPHRDGFGYAWRDASGTMAIRRYGRAELARTPRSFPDPLGERSTLAIGHVRKASKIYRDRVTVGEVHPFAAGGVFLAHNGTIHDADLLDPEPGIDSQKLARWLARAWRPRTPEGLLRALERLLATVRNFSAIDLLLTDGHVLYAFCCYARSEDEDYYTLWFRKGEDTVVVSSEPVDDGPGWVPMRNGELLWVAPGLEVRRRVFRPQRG